MNVLRENCILFFLAVIITRVAFMEYVNRNLLAFTSMSFIKLILDKLELRAGPVFYCA